MKFQCYTLGCKVNQYETQAMEQQLLALGHTAGTDADDCDAYLINTCTVTAVADRKNRTLIRRLRREHPQAVIGVCGCYAQVSAGEVEALGVDVVSGSGGREAFVQLVLDAVRQKKAGQDAGQQVLLDDAMRRRAFESLPAGSLGTRTRAMLKVQDGCCNFCTYCIIPYARGPVRSLPLAQAVEQARALEGYREIVLTGINLGSYCDGARRDPSATRLAGLLRRLLDATADLHAPGAFPVRFRISSIEPRDVDDALVDLLAAADGRVCRHLHLPLQAGSSKVLREMARPYDADRFRALVERLYAAVPGLALSTDVIAGFPGETDAEFQETLELARACRFAKMHAFPYSRRAGTPAAERPDQVPPDIKAARAAALRALGDELRAAERARRAGTVELALVEEGGVAMSESYFELAASADAPVGSLVRMTL